MWPTRETVIKGATPEKEGDMREVEKLEPTRLVPKGSDSRDCRGGNGVRCTALQVLRKLRKML